jgi:DNA ligase-4
LLLRLFRRLRSSETKWIIRMLSKNYSPAQVPETLAMSEFHFLLPDLLRFQSTIHAAVDLLSASTIRCMPIQPAADTRDRLREAARWELKPQVGTMATRPIYDKARSIRHCCQLASARRMSVERKYDGEYCQIHVALNESGTCIKIFSKSGRDSTIDRIGIHRPLRDSLGLNTKECKIKKQCMLEGELLVWNDDYGIYFRAKTWHNSSISLSRALLPRMSILNAQITEEPRLLPIYYLLSHKSRP